MRDWGDYLKKILTRESIRENVPLRELTTFRIGGPARWCVEIRGRESLVEVIRACRKEGIPYFLLGGGSNVLFSDEGFEGLVILNKIGNLEPVRRGLVECGAGVELMDLIRYVSDRSLSGIEKLAGIPGSVGGAVVGNAGAFGQTISEILESVEIITETGEVVRESPEALKPSYRETRLKYSGEVVLSARFRFQPGDRDRLIRTIEEILSLRAEKHPPRNLATAGSFFKNLPPEKPGERRIAAGLILDRAGVHGLAVGDAAVFEKHANIVVNRGHARAVDVLTLTARMKRMAMEKEGVKLEEEVRRIGFRAEELARYDREGVPSPS